jgi:hypothetical protein
MISFTEMARFGNSLRSPVAEAVKMVQPLSYWGMGMGHFEEVHLTTRPAVQSGLQPRM